MDNTKWPSWRYDPETKEGRIFEAPDDVPEGWVERLGDEPTAKPKPAAKPAKTDDDAAPMARKDIMAELKNGGIAFDAKAKSTDLYDLLKGKVMEALTAKNITFDAEASAADLLKLLG